MEASLQVVAGTVVVWEVVHLDGLVKVVPLPRMSLLPAHSVMAQQHANNLCDRVGTDMEGLGRASAGQMISDGIRCTQAQNAANKACGK